MYFAYVKKLYLINGEACMEIQRRRYDELSLKTCTNSVSGGTSFGNENVNYRASVIV